MHTVERDPEYIAIQLRRIRQSRSLTQENLAHMAGVSTRTIEKAESGRHRPDEQTLRSIARVMQVDVSYFEKLTPEEEAKQKALFDRAVRKNVVIPTSPARSVSDFSAFIEQREALLFDKSEVKDDEAFELAASLCDHLTDLGDVWEDLSATHRLEYVRELVAIAKSLETLGYLCFTGQFRQQLRDAKGRIIFRVGVMSLLRAEDAPSRRFALISLEGGWETVEEERLSV